MDLVIAVVGFAAFVGLMLLVSGAATAGMRRPKDPHGRGDSGSGDGGGCGSDGGSSCGGGGGCGGGGCGS